MVLAQTVWPVWLLQGKGTLILVCPEIWPLIFIGWALFRTTICTKCAGERLSDTGCMILAQHKNNVQIIIFREMPWDMTSCLDKNIHIIWFKIRMCIEIGSLSWTDHNVSFLTTTTMFNMWPWALTLRNDYVILMQKGAYVPPIVTIIAKAVQPVWYLQWTNQNFICCFDLGPPDLK